MRASDIYRAILEDEADMPEAHAFYRLPDGTIVHTAQEELDARRAAIQRGEPVPDGGSLHQRVLPPGTKRINTSTGRALRARREAGEKVGFHELADEDTGGPLMSYEQAQAIYRQGLDPDTLNLMARTEYGLGVPDAQGVPQVDAQQLKQFIQNVKKWATGADWSRASHNIGMIEYNMLGESDAAARGRQGRP